MQAARETTAKKYFIILFDLTKKVQDIKIINNTELITDKELVLL